MALFFLYLHAAICFSKREPGTLFGELSKGRHLLLMMGFFSFYCGLIYNDFTSIPMNIFGDSCYVEIEGETEAEIIDDECIYKVGVDPVWYESSNELTYMNSLKMKLAVIFGVL